MVQPYEITLLSNQTEEHRLHIRFYYLMKLHYSQTFFAVFGAFRQKNVGFVHYSIFECEKQAHFYSEYVFRYSQAQKNE